MSEITAKAREFSPPPGSGDDHVAPHLRHVEGVGLVNKVAVYGIWLCGRCARCLASRENLLQRTGWLNRLKVIAGSPPFRRPASPLPSGRAGPGGPLVDQCPGDLLALRGFGRLPEPVQSARRGPRRVPTGSSAAVHGASVGARRYVAMHGVRVRRHRSGFVGCGGDP